MKTKPIESSSNSSIDGLYDRLLFWLYEKPSERRAVACAEKLSQALKENRPNRGSIFTEECKALICEARQDLKGAVKHRENEIKFIRRLHDLAADHPDGAQLRSKHSFSDLRDRMTLLAVLDYDLGDVRKALAVLNESRKMCKSRQIEFEDEDLIVEYRGTLGNCRSVPRVKE